MAVADIEPSERAPPIPVDRRAGPCAVSSVGETVCRSAEPEEISISVSVWAISGWRRSAAALGSAKEEQALFGPRTGDEGE